MYSFLAPNPARLICLTTLAVGFLCTLPGCSKDDEPAAATPAAPARISVPQAGIFPEGIQWDEANKRFYVSSRAKGTVGTVRDDSTYTEFGRDNQSISNNRLISTIGLNLDAGRQRLLAAVSDNNFNPSVQNQPTLRKLAALATFNTSTGAMNSFVNLASLPAAAAYPNHFANDIAVDAAGNAYITDSMSPIIYKVDLQGNATVFLENAQFSGGTGFGLNGIVYHPDGYLLTAKTSDGTLFKVPISNPAGFTTVTKTQSLVGADGLLLFDNNTLLVVAGSQSTVFRMTTANAWATTTSTGSFATGAVSPTTITKRGSDAYVLYPYGATAPRFKIVKVNF
ncbi:SMP-30/gluconolactonase/LRE family protein [Hymenobacter sp. DH14]|uniref:SMP-30/gluconolactonase/LRE family protein n=1 Tax=Hymenobacter cyanobacteriorum TaxID=2926463 RepID=A0A9X2AIU1_9BACT|nr:SMP-30/gluconolactonase/LRE family protein [Hymenobacter cyanobacteriorum]MCI1189025.1 SMP-30/gluconolactonase/LRE family protein [Hymenobacter cyanobacteriorum]